MVQLLRSLLLLSSASTLLAKSSHSRVAASKKRSNVLTDPTALPTSADYVIVGGGTAGLTIAGRLSADSSKTVVVIEAGSDGEAVMDSILAPAQAYIAGIANLNSDYDWHYETSNQTNLNGRQIYWPRGKVLGGSSAVNGLYMIRASQIEHDSWASLNPGSSSLWGWDAIYPYMKKSETWTNASPANVQLADMVTDASLHGSDGPIHYSYPGFFYPQTGEWMPTLAALGIETRDPAGGEGWGAFIATSAINPSNYTRSYSKTGYLDPAAGRTNLYVLTGYQATKINFSGTTATGVTFAASAAGQTYSINANTEVILSAGVIGTPQLLQASGVGPSSLLTPLGIDVVVDLPGVGMHLTDHLSSEICYNTTGVEYTGDLLTNNATYEAEQLAAWKVGDATSLFNSPNDAVAYINLTTLFGGETAANAFIAELIANKSAAVAAYSTDATVQAGYNATYSADIADILPSAVGQAEILLANTGTYGGYGTALTVCIQAALQHPFSRGSVQITSASTFTPPTIDAGYFTHPADVQILRQAFKYARTIGQTAPLANYFTNELSPGAAVSTDAEWEAWIRGAASTEYHPAGSASMLPQEQGGVVDTSMRVYGTTNLRVIDSSIVPISFSAHMTAPLYGIAERAYAILTSTNTTTTTTTSTGTKASGTSSGSSGNSGSQATASSTPSSPATKLAASLLTIAVLAPLALAV